MSLIFFVVIFSDYLVSATRSLLCFLFCCSNVSEMRQRHKDTFLKKHGVKLGFMSAFIKASAHALQSEPTVNAGQLLFVECLHQ